MDWIAARLITEHQNLNWLPQSYLKFKVAVREPNMENAKDTGVYLWRNLVTKKVYVGGAYRGFEHRKKAHLKCLRGGYHCNKHLQRSWLKHGEINFEFEILLVCEPQDVRVYEQCYIDCLKAANQRHGYNICPTAGSTLGVKQSKETLAKNTNKSEVTRAKLRAANLGKKHSPESREKMKITNKGKGVKGLVVPEERRKRISATLTGRKLAADHKSRFKGESWRKAISDGLRGKKQSKETVEKRVASLRGQKRTDEQKARISEGRRLAKLKREKQLCNC